MKRKPRIEYQWHTIFAGVVEGYIQEVAWSLYGANGEYMCGSGNETYRDKTDARRAVRAVIDIFAPVPCPPTNYREVGPGRKPKP